jgi:hypothetical protein
MAVSYPLSLPTHTRMAQVDLRAINVVAYGRSQFTFAGQAHVYPGKLWSIDVTLPPMKRTDAEKWVAWMVSLKGLEGTFYMGDQLAQLPMGSARDADTILINGATSSGDTLAIDDAPASQTGYLKAGDYLHVGTSTDRQLFKVLSDVDTDGTGAATVDVWPNVRTSIADNAAVTVQEPQGVFRLATNDQAWSVNNLAVFGLSFSAREAI